MIALCTIVMLMCSSMHLSAADSAPGDDNLDLGTIEDVSAASAVSPELIGADGDDFTQVAAAQALGWTGWGVRLCLIDDALDIYHPNFGNCTGVRQPGYPTCRVYWGWNGGYGSDGYTRGNRSDPTPKLPASQTHGTHVAGIMAGSFPAKLTDSKGKLLPYQRGVAYRGMIGIFKVSNDDYGNLDNAAIDDAMKTRVQKAKCRIVNMSFGGNQAISRAAADADEVAALKAADIMPIAAAGNSGLSRGPVPFSAATPGNSPDVFAVAHLNNTVNPGSLLEVDREITTADGDRSLLIAVQRADTAGSPCMPSCDTLKLPLEIFLMTSTSASADCVPLDWASRTPKTLSEVQGKVLLLQFAAGCQTTISYSEVWEVVDELKPALVLFALPPSDSYRGVLHGIQVPVMWMRSDDGMALAQAVAAADPDNPIKLTKVPGATVADLPEEYARQPALTSSMGPRFDLAVKPDIAAPGTLYSSVATNNGYQVFPGTSMASPYVAGVAGLWLESKLKASAFAPEGGWTQAAFVALQNTARPWPFPGSDLMWPPAKVGAGVVQARNVILNTVSITPRAVSLRTDVTSQRITLTLHNTGSTALTYKVTHKAAVGLSLGLSWYKDAYDTSAPTASVLFSPDTVTVAAGGISTVTANVITTTALQARDDVIFSGYFTFTPTTGIPSTTANGKPFMSDPIVLSVPYQGASRDYSSAGSSGSSGLAVIAPARYDINPGQAALAARGAHVCNKYNFLADTCDYTRGVVRLRSSDSHLIALPLVRPVASYKFQVWNQQGNKLLGTSDGDSELLAATAYSRPRVEWYGSWTPVDDKNGTTVEMQVGEVVRLKLLLTAPMAVGDLAAGRRNVSMKPFVLPVTGAIVRIN